ncbi:GNAT family N-acetyltransferase [Pedobacter sp. ISL-68]|uniref:GNAT family N-acetyltransferase n=1 Tax=unclassified Pedobacter TaxID=2628915 RepID=UPI001BE5EC0E|nr:MULTISPECIES: GNAT family N-acetyltransferase [unclassified Pedobacter]MBT2560508.1 GNAT family N-acetyltransferase [Pedobacter sp. ISL-64]MBT2593241.1 GNAT family N-acetyltransferase [Pedobacter sp. ISL-68]
MEQIIIERATLADINKLQEIGRTTFSEAFAAVNSEENMKEYLEKGFSEEKLKGELSNQDSQFYFAQLDGKVIGYLKINTGQAQTEKLNPDALEIERIYLLKAFYGQKVGQLLYQKVIDIALEMQASYVWLGVWEENYRALRFYEKNGFTPFGKHKFWLGDDEQTDLMMKKVLLNDNELKVS